MKKKILRDFFGGKDLNMPTNPDEAVAYGGTVQAANLTYVKSDVFNNILLLDVNPLTIGIEMTDAMTKPFIRETLPYSLLSKSPYRKEKTAKPKETTNLVSLINLASVPHHVAFPRSMSASSLTPTVSWTFLLRLKATWSLKNGVDGKLHKLEAQKFKWNRRHNNNNNKSTQSLAFPRRVQMAYTRQNKLPP